MRQLWGTAILACSGDVVTTWYGLSIAGFAEMNPLVALLMAEVGVLPALVVSKLAVLAFGAFAIWWVDSHEWTIPTIIVVMYSGVITFNMIQLLL